jgi:SulP family sulfate permease
MSASRVLRLLLCATHRMVDARTLAAHLAYALLACQLDVLCDSMLCCAVLQDPLYKPLLGQLARMSFFSAAVHQLVFTIFSTLPFAVGQPQVGQRTGLPDRYCFAASAPCLTAS